MNNKTKGVIAGIAGLALLGGGTTFALWSDSATLGGATITNGNLDVTATGSMAWFDVSSDNTDAPDSILSIGDWRMVPGDTIRGTQGLTIALDGDNLVAQLDVAQATGAAALPTGVSATYRLLSGTTVVGSADLGDPLLVELDTADSGSYSVEVVVAFAHSATGAQTEEAELEDIVVSLTQVRP